MAALLMAADTLPPQDPREILQQLALEETLLGVLKSKDKTGSGKIHSSDFQRGITDLGFPVGSFVVQDMLVHCVIDELGNLDFSPLEAELKSRRRILSSKPKPVAQPLPSSRAANASEENIWQVEQEFTKRESLEQQGRLVKEYRQELLTIFKQFSHGQVKPAEVLDALEDLGIMCTSALRKLLQEQGEKDVDFVQFCRVLTKYDPSEVSLSDQGIGAGSGVQTEENAHKTAHRNIRRSDHESRARMQARSDHEYKTPTGKLIVNDTRSYGDAALFKSSTGVRDQIQTNLDQGHALSMLTHNQEQMLAGVSGAVPTISYSSEIRLQREQVLAALRKLDSDEISLDEFYAKSRSIGFSIPPNLLKLLQENKKVGKLPWRTCIGILDSTVFKKKALDLAPSSERLDSIKNAILDVIKASDGASALINLETAFRTMDTDHDEALSLNELRVGLQKVGLELDDHDLRCLFHSLDKDGDGSLNVEEFIAILRPAIPNARQTYVRNAFTKLDRFCAGAVAVDDLMDVFNADAHVDVVSGIKTSREVVKEMLQALSVLENEGVVTYERFLNYYTSLSALVASDAAFIDMIKSCWGVSDKAPAPVLGRQFSGRTLNSDPTNGSRQSAPIAKQHYGDIIGWNQEESWLEKRSSRSQRDLSLLQQVHSRDSDVINWTQKTPTADGGSSKSKKTGAKGAGQDRMEGFRQLSGQRRERLAQNHQSQGTKDTLHWTTSTSKVKAARSPDAASTQAPPSSTEESEGGNRAAGHSTLDRQKTRDSSGVRLQGGNNTYSDNARRNFGGPTPFGVSYEDPSNVYATEFGGPKNTSRGAGGAASAPKSLASVMAVKAKQPKSLLSHLQQ